MDYPIPTLELTLQRKTDSGYPIVAALTHPGRFLPLRSEGTLTLDIYGHLILEMQDQVADLIDELITPVALNIAHDCTREGIPSI